MLAYRDITLKTKINDRQGLEEKLLSMGARLIKNEKQHDIYFQVSEGKLKYRKSPDSEKLIHYKRERFNHCEKTVVFRYERNPSEEAVKKLFHRLPLLAETKKIRSLFQKNNVSIHIDEMSDGRQFLELEAKDFGGKRGDEQLKKECFDVFYELGFCRQDLIQTGYQNL